MRNMSTIALVAALIVFGLMALAGVLLVQVGEESLQRLGLLFGVIGTAVAALVALLKADQAATNTNGNLDARIQAAVHRANAARRAGDLPADPEA